MRPLYDFAAQEIDAAMKEVEASFDAANESNAEMESLRERIMQPQLESRERILTIAGAIDTALRLHPKENNNLVYEAELLYRLMNFKPLTRLTGEDSEWIPFKDVNYDEISYLNFDDLGKVTSIEVNRRCPSVVRANHDNKYAWDGDARQFTNDDGKSFFTDWRSTKKITFPYIPDNTPEYLSADETPDDCAYKSPDDIPEELKASLAKHLEEENEEEA